MAGGKGTRFTGAPEKPLAEVAGRPMIERVITALEGSSKVSRVTVVTTPDTPLTEELARELGAHVVRTPGEGYVRDLRTALRKTGTPALTVTADLPTLTPDTVDRLLTLHATHPEPSTSYWVPKRLVERLGLTTWGRHEDEIAGEPAYPTGVNVVGDTRPTPETRFLLRDPRLACNVNTRHDAETAERVLKEGDPP